jgi:hypothetical protein
MVNRTFLKAGFVGITALVLFGSMTAMAQNGCEHRIHNAENAVATGSSAAWRTQCSG